MPTNLKMDKNGKILRKPEITKSDSRSKRKYEQSIVKNLPQNNTPRPDCFTCNFQQTSREEIILLEKAHIFFKLLLLITKIRITKKQKNIQNVVLAVKMKELELNVST